MEDLKDWVFYPFILLLASAMIYVALNWGGEEQSYVVGGIWRVEKTQLDNLTISDGTTLKMNGVDSAIMRANYTSTQIRAQGIFTTIAGSLANAYQEKDLEIIIRARKAREKPAEQFQIAFLTIPSVSGSFSWRNFEATEDYRDYIIPTKLGRFEKEEGVLPAIYLGIWPDADGKGGGIEVESYVIRPVNAED